jgi:Protein of unknown function (DUF3551)
MRTLTIALFVVAAGLLGETQLSDAQSAYSYPWCSLGGSRGSNALSCYFTSWEQCRATMSGRGGNCVESPYYHAQPPQPPHRALVKPRHHRQAHTVRVSSPERLE